MKNFYGLFILIISVSTLGTEINQDIMNKIKDVAQKPEIRTGSFSSIRRFVCDDGLMNALADNDYTNAISNWMLSHGVSSNDVELAKAGLLTPEEETNAFWQTRIDTLTQNAQTADAALCSMNPSTILPILFQILEEGSFGTNEYVKRYVNWHEGDSEPVVFNYFGKPIKEDKVPIYYITYDYIFKIFNLDTWTNWKITAACFRGNWSFPHREPCYDYAYYWWYDGRKFATNIWNDFYRCWQYEQARSTPRPTVLKQLAEEISGLGISALPIVKDAIQGGDTTLDPVLKALAERLEIGGITNMNYLSWYSQNGDKFTLPTCYGLAVAKARISDTNYVNEIDGIYNTNRAPRISNAYPGAMKIYADQINCFYTNHPSVPNYWYYKLPDDVLEVDENFVFDLDRNCTNYNPRFLTPSAE